MEGTSYNPEYNPEQDLENKKRPSAETIGSIFLQKNPEFELKKDVTKEKLGQALLDFEMNKPRRETNFELDPILRHMDEDFEYSGTTGTSSLSGLLQKADQSIATENSNQDDNKLDAPAKSSASTLSKLKMADIVMYSVIFVLATLVTILIISRT